MVIKEGETHSGQTITKIDRDWVNYKSLYGYGQCRIGEFESSFVEKKPKKEGFSWKTTQK